MKISQDAWVAPDARLAGDITLEDGASIWFHCTIRAEEAPVFIGKDTNVQDNCVIHTDPGFPVVLKDQVTVGHGCILHGCQVDEQTLVGMGSIILDGARIGRHCLVGAGSLVTQDTVIPDGSLVLGSPARVIRPLDQAQIDGILASAEEYVQLSRDYRDGKYPL